VSDANDETDREEREAPGESDRASAVASAIERADALRREGRHEDAVKALAEALKHGIEQAILFYQLGNVYVDAEDLARAEAAYRKALDVDPYHANALHNLAVVYKRQGRTALFVSTYRRALKESSRVSILPRRRRSATRPRWWARHDVRLLLWLCAAAAILLLVLRLASG